MKLFRLFGIEIRADLSVLIIFLLVLVSIGTGVLAQWHPGWGPVLRWGTAVGVAVLFFLSLLLHELAHSVVARAFGIPVPRITLFLFGGVSEMEREPDSPGRELLIAVVGPATSVVLGVLCLLAFGLLNGPALANRMMHDPEHAFASLGALSTMLVWLGPINIVLGIFNLIPGFPLDGGRVLRAGLWKATGDLERATRWASLAGRGFGWVLMALGVVEVLGGAFQGFWLMLIGWFLQSSAQNAYAQLLLRQALEGLVVRDLMRTDFEILPADLTVATFIDRHLLHGAQLAWPVRSEAGFLGLVTFDTIRQVPPGERATRTIGELVQPVQDPIAPDLGGREALERLVRSHHDPLVVMDDGEVLGLLQGADIARWLALHQLDHG